jgi:hypothetical protein
MEIHPSDRLRELWLHIQNRTTQVQGTTDQTQSTEVDFACVAAVSTAKRKVVL